MIIRIVDEKSVVDVLLDTLGVVAVRYERTGLPSSGAFLHPGGLGQSLVVSLHAVHDDSPLARGVDGSERGEVGGGAGTEESLLAQLHQAVHAVVGVGEDVLVEGGHPGVVVLDGVRDVVGRVLGVLQTPGQTPVLTAGWNSFVLRAGGEM